MWSKYDVLKRLRRLCSYFFLSSSFSRLLTTVKTDVNQSWEKKKLEDSTRPTSLQFGSTTHLIKCKAVMLVSWTTCNSPKAMLLEVLKLQGKGCWTFFLGAWCSGTHEELTWGRKGIVVQICHLISAFHCITVEYRETLADLCPWSNC